MISTIFVLANEDILCKSIRRRYWKVFWIYWVDMAVIHETKIFFYKTWTSEMYDELCKPGCRREKWRIRLWINPHIASLALSGLRFCCAPCVRDRVKVINGAKWKCNRLKNTWYRFEQLKCDSNSNRFYLIHVYTKTVKGKWDKKNEQIFKHIINW